MKKLLILSLTAFLILSCKKNTREITEDPAQYSVTTFAGSGVRGSVDGSATSAQLNAPSRIAIDTEGNIYVSDYWNFSVRKIAKNGTVTTLAGGSKGTADGEGAGAQFIAPAGLAVDAQNNIYVADSTRIRKITPSGKVTTFAGGLTAGHVNGTANAAQFDQIFSIAADKQGNLYALEQISFNSQIRKISSGGVVTTFLDTTQKFETGGILPNNYDMVIDGSGNLFVARSGFLEYYIYKITPSKTVSLFASTPFISGIGISPVTGDIFISGSTIVCTTISSCTYHYKVYSVTSSGNSVAIAGGETGFAEGAGNIARFGNPTGLAVDMQGNIYVADATNNRIMKISKK